jgi:aminoglycoside phosphotransferase (APT) family kinase protein
MRDDRDFSSGPPADWDNAKSADPLRELARAIEDGQEAERGRLERVLLVMLAAALLALGYIFAAMTDAGLRALSAAAQVLS